MADVAARRRYENTLGCLWRRGHLQGRTIIERKKIAKNLTFIPQKMPKIVIFSPKN